MTYAYRPAMFPAARTAARILAVAGALLATGPGAVFPALAENQTRAAAEQYLDDAAITARVKAALVKADNLSALDIGVETEHGVVQLSGFVDTQAQIEAAETLAEAQKGVQEVKNDLHLKPGNGAQAH